MHTEEMTISISTENRLTNEQVLAIFQDMSARLQGYSTEPLEFLADADVTLKTNRFS